eukprot:357794-Chlamydomonas_euryale.AAC.8
MYPWPCPGGARMHDVHRGDIHRGVPSCRCSLRQVTILGIPSLPTAAHHSVELKRSHPPPLRGTWASSMRSIPDATRQSNGMWWSPPPPPGLL